MGLPNRTTPIQQYAQQLRERYWLASDGHVYSRRSGVQKSRHKAGGTSWSYSLRVGIPRAIKISANSFRWLLGTGNLPNGERVLVVPHGLVCGRKTLRWADMPAPPGETDLPAGGGQDVRPSPLKAAATPKEANDEATIRELLEWYDAIVDDLRVLGVDPVKRTRTITRTITEEVPL